MMETMLKRTPLAVHPPNAPNTNWVVKHDPQKPPDVYFDTNVWISMNDDDIATLERLETQYGFRYRYSVTSYEELVLHLEDQPSRSHSDPFVKYKQCIGKIAEICYAEALPSPEMEFLTMGGLMHYLDPIWIPPTQTPLAIEIIANANTLAEVTGEGNQSSHVGGIPRYVVKPSHYRELKNIDGESFKEIMKLLDKIEPPITSADTQKMEKLDHWFKQFSHFFFLVRPSNKRIHWSLLTREEQTRFFQAFTEGAGRLFHSHCISVAKRTINDRKKVDRNDLYDMMQLLLLRDDNRLFVTDDKGFWNYRLDPQIQRVIPWRCFRTSG